jgi:putative ABC transport system permease protein
MRDRIYPTRTRAEIREDTRAELEGWIDERVAELRAGGMSGDPARRLAVEEFGDVDGSVRYAEQQDAAADRRVRVTLWLEECACDLRIAVRMLARTPIVMAVVLLTFALGIGATTAVFSVVHALLIRPLPYGDEATLAYLPTVDNGVLQPGLGGARHSGTGLVALRERAMSFSGIAGATTGNVIMTGSGDPEQVFGAELTANAFDVLQTRAAIGRTFGMADDPEAEVVVLLDDLWRRRFGGDSSLIGRRIEMSGERAEVIGVMPRGFRVPTYEQAEYLQPLDYSKILRNPDNADIRFMRLFGRMKSGVTLQTAQTELDRTMHELQQQFPRTHSGVEARVVPIRTAVAGEARPRLLVLMGAAVFVLLIACVNVAGILLARALARRNELSVRIALGAGKARLVRQFLVEGVVLAVLGGGLGLLVAQLGITALRRITTAALPIGTRFALEPRVLWFAMGVAVLAAIASSLIPGLAAMSVPAIALRRDDRRTTLSRAGRRQRLGLVTAQLAVSVVLLVGAGLFLRTVHRLSMLDLGYATDRALTFRLQFARRFENVEQDAFWSQLYEQLGALPGVRAVGGGNVPLSGKLVDRSAGDCGPRAGKSADRAHHLRIG